MSRSRSLLVAAWLVGCGTSGAKPADTAPSHDAAFAPALEAPRAALKARPKGDPQPKLSMGVVELSVAPRAPITLHVEVAATDQQRQIGLMFRDQLAEDEGMLFVFPTERYNSFWMHNTLLSLDMYFIDSDWNVVGVVEEATPLTDDPRQVPKMSQYVLEVRGGFARKHGVGEGAKVNFVPPAGEGAP